MLSFVATVGVVVALLLGADWLLLVRRSKELSTEQRAPRQILMAVLTVFGLAAIVLALPVGADNRELMIGVFGLIVSAVIALSSTTFLANAMAGLMLRSVGGFRGGDFVKVGEQFGRVTERGLFHVEIQTEDRDLTTLPNLYLVQNPLTVVRGSGTIVSATLSLGYDIAHATVEPLLKQAAEQTGLEEPFVQVLELGDYAVTYRVAGFLPEPRELLSTRSKLRKHVLDCLHGAGIEIVSPTFMNQRRVEDPVIAPPAAEAPVPVPDEAPERVIFDKADFAAKVTELQERRRKAVERLEQLQNTELSADEKQRAVEEINREIESIDHRLELSRKVTE